MFIKYLLCIKLSKFFYSDESFQVEDLDKKTISGEIYKEILIALSNPNPNFRI